MPSQEPPFLTNLRYGQSSPEVARLQGVLRKLGYFTYPENTGYYGPITEEAVLQFQLDKGVISFAWQSLFGFFCGAKTRTALNVLLGSA
jgi:peptidoglycan hydrolase-like protein with peptidoglycan-binding domain